MLGTEHLKLLASVAGMPVPAQCHVTIPVLM